ncbi:hypothetical protein LEP1GSC110_1417 [Leptospira interrogans serovar Medanensis str. UT053]|nr:hypothetical protein LEP1GSC110_1417 [Leptospira interrogans serovar Medanensis str. UT053]
MVRKIVICSSSLHHFTDKPKFCSSFFPDLNRQIQLLQTSIL